ncbi:hypothetical protein ACFLUU_04110 [Chloroflexota bacterium]
MEKRLDSVNKSEWDYEDFGIIKDDVFRTETMASELSSILQQIVEDVGNAQNRLSDIRPS